MPRFALDPNSFKTIKIKYLESNLHARKPQTCKQIQNTHVLIDIYDFFENEIKKFKKHKYHKINIRPDRFGKI